MLALVDAGYRGTGAGIGVIDKDLEPMLQRLCAGACLSILGSLCSSSHCLSLQPLRPASCAVRLLPGIVTPELQPQVHGLAYLGAQSCHVDAEVSIDINKMAWQCLQWYSVVPWSLLCKIFG